MVVCNIISDIQFRHILFSVGQKTLSNDYDDKNMNVYSSIIARSVLEMLWWQ